MRSAVSWLVSSIVQATSRAADRANDRLSRHKPLTLVAGGVVLAVAGYKAWLWGGEAKQEFTKRRLQAKQVGVQVTAMQFLVDNVYGMARAVPVDALQKIIDKEIDDKCYKMFLDLRNQMRKEAIEAGLLDAIPEHPIPIEELMGKLRKVDEHYRAGKTSGARYAVYSDEDKAAMAEISLLFMLTNPLHTESWPSVQQMHNALTAQTATLMGDPEAYGVITDGGTGSIQEAVKAYARHGREKLGIAKPRIIIPETAHAAFYKAAQVQDLDIVVVPVDPETKQVDVKEMERHINSDTVLLVGSSPNYPYGVYDDIPAIAKLAQKYSKPGHQMGCHVDACLGGFINPFAARAGFTDVPHFDFSLPGVTSMSVDRHKYGQVPKGFSECLFRRDHPAKDYLAHVFLRWSGGLYVTPTVPGSRTGLMIALAYFISCRMGMEGYVRQAKGVIECTRTAAAACAEVEGLRLATPNPLSCVIPLVADGLPEEWSIHVVKEFINKKGWELATVRGGLHISITAEHAAHSSFVDDLVRDLTEAVAYVRANPEEKPSGTAKAYGDMDVGLVPEGVEHIIGARYQAVINTSPHVALTWLGETAELVAPALACK